LNPKFKKLTVEEKLNRPWNKKQSCSFKSISR